MKRYWTADRLLDLEEFLSIGESDTTISRRLGKTVTAVRMARKHYGIRCRRRLIMTLSGVARLMGISCQKTVATWARAGWLRSRPGARLANGRERYVSYDWLLAFLENPDHWHVWRPEQIKDPQLLAWAERIRTPYLTVGQAAERLCVGVGTVWGYVRRGLLPARRWGNWLIPEDALSGFVLLCDRPRPSWTPERRIAAAQRMRDRHSKAA